MFSQKLNWAHFCSTQPSLGRCSVSSGGINVAARHTFAAQDDERETLQKLCTNRVMCRRRVALSSAENERPRNEEESLFAGEQRVRQTLRWRTQKVSEREQRVLPVNKLVFHRCITCSRNFFWAFYLQLPPLQLNQFGESVCFGGSSILWSLFFYITIWLCPLVDIKWLYGSLKTHSVTRSEGRSSSFTQLCKPMINLWRLDLCWFVRLSRFALISIDNRYIFKLEIICMTNIARMSFGTQR